MQSIVRRALPEDEQEIWRLFREHHEENAFFPLSEAKVQYYLDRVLRPETIDKEDNGPRGVIGVIGEVGVLQAAIMLVLGTPWYSESIVMDDCMSFVDKRYRKSQHATALIEYSKFIVDQIRQTHPDFSMIVGIVSNVRTIEKVRLYSRRLKPIGAYFMYPPLEGSLPLKEVWSNEVVKEAKRNGMI